MPEEPHRGKVSDPREMYTRLREMMLKNARPRTIPPALQTSEPWGVLMDWGVKNGTATVMSMSDGSASVYLSSGGGFIGGQGIEPVRMAAQEAVAQARKLAIPDHATTDFPLPHVHEVVFYFLCDTGVHAMRTNEIELKSPDHSLRKLGDAMQAVITQFRLWQARAKSGESGANRKPN